SAPRTNSWRRAEQQQMLSLCLQWKIADLRIMYTCAEVIRPGSPLLAGGQPAEISRRPSPPPVPQQDLPPIDSAGAVECPGGEPLVALQMPSLHGERTGRSNARSVQNSVDCSPAAVASNRLTTPQNKPRFH